MREKVLVLSSSFPKSLNDSSGFIYDFCMNLSKELEVFVLAPIINDSLAFEERENIKVYRHKITPFGDFNLCTQDGMVANLQRNPLLMLVVPFFFISQFLALHKVIFKHSISVVQANWLLPSGFVAGLYKKLFKKNLKIILTARGSDVNSFKDSFSSLIKRAALTEANIVVCVSTQLKEGLQKLGYKKEIFVYPTGVYTNLFVPKPKPKHEPHHLLFVGSLIQVKGILELLSAIKEVVKVFPNLKLTVVGDGALMSKLKKYVSDNKLDKNIYFCGHINNTKLPPYYQKADVFVLPSYNEGFPVTLSEALSSGMFCISNKLPITLELESKYDFVKTVNIKNIKEFSDAIIHVLSSPKIITKALVSARKFALENLSKESTNNFYISVIKDLNRGRNDI